MAEAATIYPNIAHFMLAKKLLDRFPTLHDTTRIFYISSKNPSNIWFCNNDQNTWESPSLIFSGEFIAGLCSNNLDLIPDETRLVSSKNGRDKLRKEFSLLIGMDSGHEWDRHCLTNLDLFATTNGVFDTSAPSIPFRPLLPADYLSLTTGWAYSPTEAQSARPELELYLNQVQPVPEEQHVVLAYLASLLGGKRTAVRLLVITDDRGGKSGKTLFTQLVKLFFGQSSGYAAEKDSTRFATDSLRINRGSVEKKTKNARFKGRRLMFAEELNIHMRLDESLFLKLLSPMSDVTDHHGTDYTWSAGFMMVFSMADRPFILDYYYDSLLDQVMVAPFRSKFLSPEELEEGDLEPQTYPVDIDISSRFPTWLSALADILREAYASSFDTMQTLPQSMLDWRARLTSP